MVSNDYYWYEIDNNNKIGNQVITPLNMDVVKNTIGIYLVNPIEKNKIKDLPKLVKNIEQNTKNNLPSDDKNEIWSDDKMGEFNHMLEQAFTDIMDARLNSLIKEYIPNEEKRNWESFNDFIGEKHYLKGPKKGQKMEGTGISDDLKLKDLLDSDGEKEFIGETISVGRSDRSTAQKELLAKNRILNNGEFFGLSPKDDGVLSSVSVKYQDNQITVNFEIDQTSAKIPKKIFEDAGFKKVVFKDDPTSYGGSIRDKYSPNWNDITDESKFSQGKDQGRFDPLSIWVGDSKQKEESRKEYSDKLIRQFVMWKKKALEMLAGLKGRIDRPKKDLAKLKEQLKTTDSGQEERHGVSLPLQTKKPKEGESSKDTKQSIREQIKDYEEFLYYIEMNHKDLWEGKRTFAEERKHISKLKGSIGAKYIEGQAAQVRESKGKFEQDRTIPLGADEVKLIRESWKEWEDHEVADKTPIRKLVEKWIKDERMIEFLKGRVNRNAWFLHRTTVTLHISPDNIKGNDIYIPSKGKVETTKMVSEELLTQPAQMTRQRQRKHSNLPVSRKSGGGATKVSHDPTGATEKMGINAARKWWFRKFNIRHNKLKNAMNLIAGE